MVRGIVKLSSPLSGSRLVESVGFWGEPLEVLAPMLYAPPMDPSCIPPCVYQFRVVVQGISPLIWRRLLVRSDMCLAARHITLQIVFAWSDVHLHGCRLHGKEYGSARLGGPGFDVAARHVPLVALRLH
jgi:Plasmid pRiA4b ORF-3-like protein